MPGRPEEYLGPGFWHPGPGDGCVNCRLNAMQKVVTSPEPGSCCHREAPSPDATHLLYWRPQSLWEW